MRKTTARILISYSQDSIPHVVRVRELVERLRQVRFECVFDLELNRPAQGWALWWQMECARADVMLLVWSPGYQARAEQIEGSAWPGAVLSLWRQAQLREKIIHVILADEADPFAGAVARLVEGAPSFVLPREFEQLYWRLKRVEEGEK